MIRLREHLGLLGLLALLSLVLGACSDDAGELTDDDSAASDDDDSATSDDDDSAASDDDDSAVDSDSDGTPDEWDCGPTIPRLPRGPELCNGVDDNCDVRCRRWLDDATMRMFPACAGDCEDGNPAVHPGAADTCDGSTPTAMGTPRTSQLSGQEMFISSWGHLYITIPASTQAATFDMNAPVPVADMVGEVHSAVGVEVDVGAVLPCTEMLFTAIACGNPFNSSDPSAFRITPQGENHWLVEIEDSTDNDYTDLPRGSGRARENIR